MFKNEIFIDLPVNNLGINFMFHVCLQEAEWHCDEFTKGACFSRGKSEVSTSKSSYTLKNVGLSTQHWVKQWPNDVLKQPRI